MTWRITEQIIYLEKLLTPGVIGEYRSFEVTEIVGFQRDISVTNFMSLLGCRTG